MKKILAFSLLIFSFALVNADTTKKEFEIKEIEIFVSPEEQIENLPQITTEEIQKVTEEKN